MTTASYPGFEYVATQLSKFLAASDFFTIMLYDGGVIHYTPLDEDSFKQWLLDNNVKDIRDEEGWISGQAK